MSQGIPFGRKDGRTDGRTDGQTDTTMLVVDIRNFFANAPKN